MESRKNRGNLQGNDLKFIGWHTFGICGEAADEFWTNHLFTSHGGSAVQIASRLCETILGRTLRQTIFLHGPIPVHGVAQLAYRESLRAMQPKLYHMGIRGKVSRSTLADANERRDWHIWMDFAKVLIRQARDL